MPIATIREGDGAAMVGDVIGEKVTASPELPIGVLRWLRKVLADVRLAEFCGWEWGELNRRLYGAVESAPTHTKVFVAGTRLVAALAAAEVIDLTPR